MLEFVKKYRFVWLTLAAFVCVSTLAWAATSGLREDVPKRETAPDLDYSSAVIYADVTERPQNGEPVYKTFEDLKGKRAAVVTGTVQDELAQKQVPDLKLQYYSSYADCVAAVENDKADVIVGNYANDKYTLIERPNLTSVEELGTVDVKGFLFARNAQGEKLQQQMNDFLDTFAASGELEKLVAAWANDEATPTSNELPAHNGTLSVVMNSFYQPLAYAGENNQPMGAEFEIFKAFCREYGYGIQMNLADLPGVVSGLSTGVYDAGFGGISYTAERAQKVYFSKPTIVLHILFVTRKTGTTSQNGIVEAFKKSFLVENRWQMVLEGFKTTLGIVLCSAVLGTILGILLCLLKLTRVRPFADFLTRLIQGIPSLVLLLIFYYVVFGPLGVPAFIVSVLCFSTNFAAYVSNMFLTGIQSVSQGQVEAARALGFSKSQTYLRIIAPQAIRTILPVYQGELISMTKMTSVVGYIAILDLTRASDVIRSRTFDAFMPLIAVAIIYFLLCFALTSLLRLAVPRKRQPKLRDIDQTKIAAPGFAHIAESQKDLIKISHVKKVYPNVVPLKDVNATIDSGEVISIIGPSGTGKSTLLRMLNRLEEPSEGTIEVFGHNMADKNCDLNAIRQDMGMVFQSFNLFEHLSIIENIMLAPVLLKGMPRQEAYEKGMALLKTVGLAQKALNYPDELSGGQKQRVAIARSLAMDPKIILFDEPTSALDPTMVGEVLSVMRQLANSGLTMLIVTHEMNFARDVSSRIFYMDEGLIFEDGTPEQVFNSPISEKTRSFVQRLKFFERSITSADVDFIEMANDLENFGIHNLIPDHTRTAIQRVFEELIYSILTQRLSEGMTLSFKLEFAQATGAAVFSITYSGEAFDPFTDPAVDELQLAVLKTAVGEHEHRYTGTQNILTIKLK